MQFYLIYDVIRKFKMAENGTIFKTRTYDFFVPFNEPKQLPKSKCAYIEDHARMLPAPGVIEQQNNVNNAILVCLLVRLWNSTPCSSFFLVGMLQSELANSFLSDIYIVALLYFKIPYSLCFSISKYHIRYTFPLLFQIQVSHP